jgi:hypothetical protein
MAITAIQHSQINTNYGEFYCFDNSTSSSIYELHFSHPVHSIGYVGALNGATFSLGSEIAITSIANGGGGTILVTTSGAHGFLANDYVSLICSNAGYNDHYQIISIGANNEFYVVSAFSTTATGYAIMGDHLIVSEAGNYMISASIACTAGIANKRYTFSNLVDSTIGSSSMIDVYCDSTNKENLSFSCIRALQKDSWISLTIANHTDTTSITVNNLNFNVIQI